MEPVTDSAMCRALISANRKRMGKVCTNCFILPGSFDPLIAEGRLSFETFPQGLCLLADEGRYVQLYYFLDPGADFPRIRMEKPVLIEEISARGGRDAEIARLEGWYGVAGFRRLKRSGYYACEVKPEEAEKAFQEKLDALRPVGWILQDVDTPERAEQVLALWDGSLDPTDIPLEHRGFLQSETDRVICVAQGTRVLGAVWYRMGKHTCEARHIVVHPDARRRGVGALLLSGVLRAAAAEGSSAVHTWISDANAASIAMHGAAGFLAQPRTCTQYIL